MLPKTAPTRRKREAKRPSAKGSPLRSKGGTKSLLSSPSIPISAGPPASASRGCDRDCLTRVCRRSFVRYCGSVKLIVFDVDGTLVDSQDLIIAAQAATFRAHGLEPPSRERSLSIVGLSLLQAFRVLAPDGPAESLAEGYKTAFQRLRADPAYREPLFKGAAELLAELAARDDVELGIATGKSRRGVAHLLDRHGWAGIFATIQTADDHPSKPHPAMLQKALAETGAEPRESVRWATRPSTWPWLAPPASARSASPGAITAPRRCGRQAPRSSSAPIASFATICMRPSSPRPSPERFAG